MTVEYAPKGLVGVLTPQANTTVEPEYAILLPAGMAYINARMMSPHGSIEDRLVDYFASIETHLLQFANAPVDVFALGTTGTSYVVGKDAEDALIAKVLEQTGKKLVTTATAVCDALEALSASKIGIVSPYPDSLTEKSVAYWESRGLDVAAVASCFQATDEFHPIYSMAGGQAVAGLNELDGKPLDAIVMLGTGMPTLPGLIYAADHWSGPPVLSCMLALVWRSALALTSDTPTKDELMPWIDASGWRDRYILHCGPIDA